MIYIIEMPTRNPTNTQCNASNTQCNATNTQCNASNTCNPTGNNKGKSAVKK